MTFRYLTARTGVVFMTLAVLITLQFFVFRLMPGDPTASVISGSMTLEVQEELKRLWGLDKPLFSQFFSYVRNIAHLEFGVSFFKNEPVIDIISERFWNTAVFMLVAMIMANIAGVLLGILSVAFRNTFLDTLLLSIASLARSTPLFVTGIFFILLFSYWQAWFPLGGMHDVGAVFSGTWDRFLNWDFVHHLFLPTIVAGTFYFTTPFLVMRTAMLEHVGSDHVLLARAKGMRESSVLARHMARNAVNPVVTSAALSIGFAVGGQVVVEILFRWPGMGTELVFSTLRRDYPVAQGIFFFISLTVITLNYLADLLYVLLDPRIRYATKE